MPQKQYVADSSTLIAFERAELFHILEKLPGRFAVPPTVSAEIGNFPLKNIDVHPIRGGAVRRVRQLEAEGIGRGEAECLLLAERLKTGFILCDDYKLIRQRYFIVDPLLSKISVSGFGYILDLLASEGKAFPLWSTFDLIINKNNWKRSEVEMANFAFLRRRGWVE